MAITMTRPIVIKFGGEIVEDPTDLNNLLTSVKQLHLQGEKIILIHGGGPLASSLSQRLGITPKKVGGRRVTDTETLEVMKMVLPGIINSNILALLKKKEVPCSTLSGINLFHAEKRPPKIVSGSGGKEIDFGAVGDLISVDTTLINLLLTANIIPVISPLCASNQGHCLNINADTIATFIAANTDAKDLVLITKVGAVFEDINNPQSKIDQLSVAQAQEKIAQGVIQGGMIPKLEESFPLLKKQLKKIHIVGTANTTTLLNEIKEPGSEGTVIHS